MADITSESRTRDCVLFQFFIVQEENLWYLWRQMSKVDKRQLMITTCLTRERSGRSVKFDDDVLKSLRNFWRNPRVHLAQLYNGTYVKSARYIDEEREFNTNYPRPTKIFDVQIHFYPKSSPKTRNGSSAPNSGYLQTNLVPEKEVPSCIQWYISLRLIETWRNSYCRFVPSTVATTVFQIVRKIKQFQSTEK